MSHKSMLVRSLCAIAALAVIGITARTSFAITVESHNLNLYRRVLDGQWFGMMYASDGNCYFGSSTHEAHSGAAFLKYDPRTHEETMLCDDITTLTGDDPYIYPQGKLHSYIAEANGWVYWATHFSSEYPPAESIWPGTHFQGYNMTTGEFRDYGVVYPNWTCYCAVTADPARNYGYVFAMPMWGAGRIFRYDLTTGAKTDLGALSAASGNCYGMFADKRGDVWFSAAYDNGAVKVIRGATGATESFPGALPPLYNWDTDTVNPSSGEQARRYWWWILPMGDGDRMVFNEAYYGGRIYMFDSTKDVASGAAFTPLAHIGYIGESSMAICGNKVFYVQRANRQQGDEGYTDFHLLSVDLHPAANPKFVDYGLIEDQTGRTVWRIPSLITDGGGTIFMDGDWWTNAGDIGTLRYHWDPATSTESYLELPRGQQCARVDMPDVLTDDFDDNTMGPIWSVTEDDHDHAWVSETNQRLEIHSAVDPSAHTAGYEANAWRFNATRDFAYRIDYHIGAGSGDAYEVGLKIAKHKDASNHAGIYAAHDTIGGDTWIAKGAIDSTGFFADAASRTATDGTLYVGYDSITDKLYLSRNGYWQREDPAKGDYLYSDLVKGAWSADAVEVQLVGTVRNADLSGGTMYFDNFTTDDAAMLTPSILTVTGNPETNVSISVDTSDAMGRQNGATCFARTYACGTSVTLTAPATTPHGSHTHNFVRWNVNGVPQTPGQASLTLNLTADTNAVAVYETATWTLGIQANPVAGVPITTMPQGVTPFAAQVNDGSPMTITAPATFVSAGKTWFFYQWTVAGAAQTVGVRSTSVTMWSDVAVVATYCSVRSMKVSGPKALYGGTTAKYRCAADFTLGPRKTVTTSARWADNSPYLRFIRPGTLQAQRVPATMKRTLTVKYGGVTARFKVTVRKR